MIPKDHHISGKTVFQFKIIQLSINKQLNFIYMHFDIMNAYSYRTAINFHATIFLWILWLDIQSKKPFSQKFTTDHKPQWAWVYDGQSRNFYYKHLYSSNFRGFTKFLDHKNLDLYGMQVFLRNKFHRGQTNVSRITGERGERSVELKYTN